MTEKPLSKYAQQQRDYLEKKIKIVEFIEQHGVVSSPDLVGYLKADRYSVAHFCKSLEKGQWIAIYDKAKVVDKRKKVWRWVRGPNREPVYDNTTKGERARRAKLHPKVKAPRVIKPKPLPPILAESRFITSEDLAWMEKYRKQHEVRLQRIEAYQQRVDKVSFQ